MHLPPTSVAAIGKTDRANHQYDLADFWAAENARTMPAVSYLKAARFQDGHPGYSGPLDEQTFLVNTINRLQAHRQWRTTAVVAAYDDSDGWYDHVMPPVLTQSQAGVDTLTDPRLCGDRAARVPDGQQARCGLGMRMPLQVISSFTRTNFVDHSLTDRSSILRFIEDNWALGRAGAGSRDAWAGSLNPMFDFGGSRGRARRLLLDPDTGAVADADRDD